MSTLFRSCTIDFFRVFSVTSNILCSFLESQTFDKCSVFKNWCLRKNMKSESFVLQKFSFKLIWLINKLFEFVDTFSFNISKETNFERNIFHFKIAIRKLASWKKKKKKTVIRFVLWNPIIVWHSHRRLAKVQLMRIDDKSVKKFSRGVLQPIMLPVHYYLPQPSTFHLLLCSRKSLR